VSGGKPIQDGNDLAGCLLGFIITALLIGILIVSAGGHP